MVAKFSVFLNFLPYNTFLRFIHSDCLGRRLGPRLLGRLDDSEVMTCFLLCKLLFVLSSSIVLTYQSTFIKIVHLLIISKLSLPPCCQQRLVKDFYKVLDQVNSENIPDDLKLPSSFSQLVSDMKDNKYNAREFAFILKGMVCFYYQIHVDVSNFSCVHGIRFIDCIPEKNRMMNC